jgi:hypothetical protein
MATRATSGFLRANSLKLHRAISILDLETTGTFVEIDRIVEIGILKVLPDGTERRYSQRVNPEIRIPQEATAIHGISDADVADAPTFKKIAREVERFLRDSDLAGFNLKGFRGLGRIGMGRLVRAGLLVQAAALEFFGAAPGAWIIPPRPGIRGAQFPARDRDPLRAEAAAIEHCVVINRGEERPCGRERPVDKRARSLLSVAKSTPLAAVSRQASSMG